MGSYRKRRLAFGLKVMVRDLKGKLVLANTTQLLTILLLLGSLSRIVEIIKLISSVVLLTLVKLLTLFLGISYGRDLIG